MSGKFKIRKGVELTKILEKLGFVFVSQKGSHIKYKYDTKHIVVPMHSELAIGTLNEIYKIARTLADSKEVDEYFLQ